MEKAWGVSAPGANVYRRPLASRSRHGVRASISPVPRQHLHGPLASTSTASFSTSLDDQILRLPGQSEAMRALLVDLGARGHAVHREAVHREAVHGEVEQRPLQGMVSVGSVVGRCGCLI